MANEEFFSPLSNYFNLYLDHCKPELSEGSYKRRVTQLHHFDRYLVSVHFTDGDPIDEVLTIQWIHSLTNASDSTVMTYVSVLRQFLKFYSITTCIPVFIPPSHKVDDDYVPYLFTDEDMSNIYDIADNYDCKITNYPFFSLQFPVIIRLLESCGFRIGELLNTRMNEVDLKKAVFKMINTKNQKERLVPLSDSMAEIVKQYCDQMNLKDPNAYLFPKDSLDIPLLRNFVSNKFRDLLVQIGIRHEGSYGYERGPCIHCIRHRFAINSMRQLMVCGIYPEDCVPYLSIYLGHESINETEKYLKFAVEMFPEELNKFEESSEDMYPSDDLWAPLYE